MRFFGFMLAVLVAFSLVGGCVVTPVPPRGQELEVSVEQGGVRMLRRGMTVSLIRTRFPNVENWKLVNGNTEIVVKSRGDRGPAAVELFDTRTGILKGKTMSNAIVDGEPDWALGFEEPNPE
jgi:hypothetical protein